MRWGWMQSTFARSAAAAAIVLVVAGGGWEVYSRIQPAQEPKAIALPPVAGHGGFSSANAIRTPKTLNGTVLTHPLAIQAKPDADAVKKATGSAEKAGKKAKAEGTKPVAPERGLRAGSAMRHLRQGDLALERSALPPFRQEQRERMGHGDGGWGIGPGAVARARRRFKRKR